MPALALQRPRVTAPSAQCRPGDGDLVGGSLVGGSLLGGGGAVARPNGSGYTLCIGVRAVVLPLAVLVMLLALAGGVGWGVGWLLHRGPVGMLLTDALQGVCGAALGLEVYLLTGPLVDGVGELIAVALLGTWVSLGAAHATAAVLRRLDARDDAGQH